MPSYIITYRILVSKWLIAMMLLFIHHVVLIWDLKRWLMLGLKISYHFLILFLKWVYVFKHFLFFNCILLLSKICNIFALSNCKNTDILSTQNYSISFSVTVYLSLCMKSFKLFAFLIVFLYLIYRLTEASLVSLYQLTTNLFKMLEFLLRDFLDVLKVILKVFTI